MRALAVVKRSSVFAGEETDTREQQLAQDGFAPKLRRAKKRQRGNSQTARFDVSTLVAEHERLVQVDDRWPDGITLSLEAATRLAEQLQGPDGLALLTERDGTVGQRPRCLIAIAKPIEFNLGFLRHLGRLFAEVEFDVDFRFVES